jgi:hypothetical protein
MSPERGNVLTEVRNAPEPSHRTSSNLTADERCDELVEVVNYLYDQIDIIKAQMFYPRCSTPAPPPPRYPHDPWARDDRPAHSCGKSAGMR